MVDRPLWWQVLADSGLCFDSARLIERVLERGWQVPAFRFCRLRFSPGVLQSALRESRTKAEAGRLFSLGMSQIKVGGTYKTTKEARTRLADETVLRRAGEFPSPGFLEVGASDGSASMELLRARAHFSRTLLTDRHNRFHARPVPGGRLFLDADGRRVGFKLLCFYLAWPSAEPCGLDGCERIETVNPAVTAEFGINAIERFDLFTDVLDEPVHLIRCANILNACYFTDADILRGVRNLMRSLVVGGYLVISHNNERYVQGEAVLSFRKTDTGFVLADDINEHELKPLMVSEGGT